MARTDKLEFVFVGVLSFIGSAVAFLMFGALFGMWGEALYLSKMTTIGGFIGGVGTVGTLLFLATELRKNDEQKHEDWVRESVYRAYSAAVSAYEKIAFYLVEKISSARSTRMRYGGMHLENLLRLRSQQMGQSIDPGFEVYSKYGDVRRYIEARRRLDLFMSRLKEPIKSEFSCLMAHLPDQNIHEHIRYRDYLIGEFDKFEARLASEISRHRIDVASTSYGWLTYLGYRFYGSIDTNSGRIDLKAYPNEPCGCLPPIEILEAPNLTVALDTLQMRAKEVTSTN